MKIFRLAANSTQFIPQNPTGAQNPDITTQNMVNAQAALSNIQEIIDAAGQVNEAMAALEDALGQGDIGIKQQVSNKLEEVLAQNDAVKLLMQMNLIPNVDMLFNANDFNRIKIQINNGVSQLQANPQPQAAMQA